MSYFGMTLRILRWRT